MPQLTPNDLVSLYSRTLITVLVYRNGINYLWLRVTRMEVDYNLKTLANVKSLDFFSWLFHEQFCVVQKHFVIYLRNLNANIAKSP